jgi:adenylate cyclase
LERRLAAILAADVVGYSRLMGADEDGTLERLKLLRRELVQPKIQKHSGRIVKLMGDGILAEFSSIVEAVRCAAKIQQAIAEREANRPEDQRIRLRIGVNLGDVIVEGSDIYGGGINVAARLEGLADPGGICISGKVYEEVRDRLDFVFEDMGEKAVKNIDRPVRVWRWINEASPMARKAGPQTPTLMIPDKPSLAVLPFDNMSGDPEQAFFADGIAEDIITALSRFRSLFVIARNSSFTYKNKAVDVRSVGQQLGVRYVLEGSVRRAANRVRVTAQLIEAETGNHLWAEQFDRELEDIFAVQDEITQRIVGALQPEIGAAEWERARRKSPDSLDAWALYHQGIYHLYRYSKADNAEARRLFRQAVEQDDQFAAAYTMLAYACFMAVFDALTDYRVDQLTESFDMAQKAVRLDGRDAMAHAILGRVLSMRHQHDLAIAECDKAIELNPNLSQAQFGRGLALVLAGRPGEAVANLENAARLSPRDPNYYAFLLIFAWADLLQGRYDGALEWARRAVAQPNSGVWGNATLAIALAHLDRREEAREALDALIEEKPDMALSFIAETLPFRRESDRLIFEDGLRRAGLAS